MRPQVYTNPVGELEVCYTFFPTEADVPRFEEKIVHQVVSTYSLTREAEWVGRLLLLELIQPDEDGIGTSVIIKHKSPANLVNPIEFIGKLKINDSNTGFVEVEFSATQKGRLIAEGKTGQKILKKVLIDKLIASSQEG